MPKKLAVKLDGNEVELKATLGAARTVNNQQGGFSTALQNIQAANMRIIAQVIAAGAEMSEAAQINTVEEAIYRGGVMNYMAPASQFVMRLANGGEDPSDAAKKESQKGNAPTG